MSGGNRLQQMEEYLNVKAVWIKTGRTGGGAGTSFCSCVR